MSPSNSVVHLENFSFRYDGADRPTLNNINLKVEKGEMVLLCGPTGCGKTTLALCLNGLIPFTTGGELSGTIEVCGFVPEKTPTPKLATKVGLVFQDPEGQLCTLFLEDEIAFGPENLLVDREGLSTRVDEMLSLIGLEHMRAETVFDLSGGQKQKVNIASVLAMQPDLLVLDMPTANLDPIGSAEVFQVIRRLVTEKDVTCIIIENRLDDLVSLADRVVVMGNDGSIAYDGSPEIVFKNGLEIIDHLGIEIPQVIELDLRLSQRSINHSEHKLPITVEEMTNRMETQLSKMRITASPTNDKKLIELQGEKVIEVEDLHFSYRKGNEILKGLSFQMHKGEMLAIVGNNGSGKTTMAKILVGLLKPASGWVKVCGLDVSKTSIPEIASKVSYVFQYPDHQFVAQGQAVRDEIAFNMVMAGLTQEEINLRVEELLESFKLKDKETVPPFTLSGGEMRTLSVACMLSTNPELLILDEPTYGQDKRRIAALMDRLDQFRAMGSSVIMISHDMRLVAEYASSVVLFNAGNILFKGTPEELFNRPDLLRIASLKAPPVHTLVSNLSELGFPISRSIVTITKLLDYTK